MNSEPDLPFATASAIDVAKLPASRRLAWLAHAVDAANDARDAPLAMRLLDLFEEVERNLSDPIDQARHHYYRSNLWALLYQLKVHDQPGSWSWEQPELLQQLLWLRRAARSPGYAGLPAVEQSMILTNLANAMSTAGRFIEALSVWREALALHPRSGMAEGNLGYGLLNYAHTLYDPGHAAVLAKLSQQHLSAAIAGGVGADGTTYQDALDGFSTAFTHAKQLQQTLGADGPIDLKAFPMGSSREEQDYREWTLKQGLFINPLNDIGPETIAARDVLVLPDHYTKKGETTYLGCFNQLKQEYATARLLLYEGLAETSTHFADRAVFLVDNSDAAVYSIAIEKVKASFRLAYSLFDKIAVFLNAYLALGIPMNEVSFRKLWFTPGKKGQPPIVRDELEQSQNWPLRGLFWISMDLFDKDIRETADPDAGELNDLRNHLEHKYLKVVEMELPPLSGEFRVDQLAQVITKSDFERRSLRLLLLARNALIHLALAVHQQERRVSRSESFVAHLATRLLDDDRKR